MRAVSPVGAQGAPSFSYLAALCCLFLLLSQAQFHPFFQLAVESMAVNSSWVGVASACEDSQP